MAAEGGIDPIHQFVIAPLFHIGPLPVTNSAVFMIAVLAAATFIMIVGTSSRALVPGRLQSLGEVAYEFVANTVRGSAGQDGMRFFPMVFSLFMFVLLSNLIGIIPYTFTVTSHIIVTFALAALVILTVILYGFYRNGMHFLHLFVPSGVSPVLLPLLVLIEVISFISRPISLSVRLFANMLAGHITLKVFGGFVTMLLASGTWAVILAPLPFAMTVALTALELLVAFLQAYVFAILTCVYLNDAIHPGH
ncbi:MAG: F0F1 ATP synthase subunit A [Alphaproteobacteria bacterium]|nr:F0F1 ATP synthase subunit A [Alphaproteobacteria bacterium]